MHFIVSVGILLFYAAFADTQGQIQGIVRVAGSGLSQEIQILQGENDKPSVLCPNDVAGRVKMLSAMTVQVSGIWKLDKQGQRSCLDSSEFRVLKHISGREPFVGIFLKGKDGFFIKSEDGREHLIPEVPKGLGKMEGKKVIIDGKFMTTSNRKVLKVVSYGEYP